MAKRNSSELTIEFDNSSGTLVDMSAHITRYGGLKKMMAIEVTTPFGAADVTRASAGVGDTESVTLGGFFDDVVTTGPHAIFNARGDTRTLKTSWGGTKTTSVEVIIESYERLPDVGKLHQYNVTVQPTGAVTEV